MILKHWRDVRVGSRYFVDLMLRLPLESLAVIGDKATEKTRTITVYGILLALKHVHRRFPLATADCDYQCKHCLSISARMVDVRRQHQRSEAFTVEDYKSDNVEIHRSKNRRIGIIKGIYEIRSRLLN